MIFLIDMDGVLNDYNEQLIARLKVLKPDHETYLDQQQTHFKLRDQFPEFAEDIQAIRTERGFIENLSPLPGSVEAIKKILDAGHEVFICTSPHTDFRNGVEEKYIWIEKHFGHPMTKRIIVTKDKTLVHGDFLLDDKPEVTGKHEPSWEHIVFAQHYNNHIVGKKRLDWSMIEEFLKSLPSHE